MAKSKRQNSFASKVGKAGQKAVAKHRTDETNYGSFDLPAGIQNGIAKLTECKFDTYKQGDNTGEYYFVATGICVEPKEHSGGRATVRIPVCKTSWASLDEQIERVLNEIRKLGGDTSDATVDDLEELVAELKEEQPFFRFSTRASKDEKYINTYFNGGKGLEDYDPEDAEDDDEIEEDDDAEEVDEDEDDDVEEVEDDDEDDEDDEDEDDDEDGDDDEGGDDEDDWEPAKKETYKYKPKGKRKSIDCVVTKVLKRKRTVNLRSADGEHDYEDVSWDKLEEDE